MKLKSLVNFIIGFTKLIAMVIVFIIGEIFFLYLKTILFILIALIFWLRVYCYMKMKE